MSIRLFFKIILLSILVACSDNQEVFLPDYTEIDYLIKNGKIVDGTGNDAFFSDLVIVEDEIVFVGDTRFTEIDKQNRIKNIIHADGRVVTP